MAISISSLVAAQPAASPLTFAAALEAARSRSTALLAQDAAARAAREMAVSASRLPDPELGLSVDNLPIEGSMGYSLTDDFMTMRSVSLTQTFTGSEKRQARSMRFEREAEAASAMRTMQEARLLIQTAQSWFDRYYQEQMLDLLQRQREEIAHQRTAAEFAYRGGGGSQADILAARTAVARINDRMQEVRAELESATALLQRWVGDAASRPLGTPPRLDDTRLAEYHLSHEIDRHPDIAVMNARERVALAEVDVARQEKNADWSWSLMYSKRSSQFGDMVSVGVSIPLQWDQPHKQDRKLAARLAQVELVRSEREEMRREHLFKVQRLLANWRSNLQRLADYDHTLIPLATQRVAAMEAAFRGGKESLAAVLEARRMVIDTSLERLRIERQTAFLWAELEFLIPQDLITQLTPAHPSSQPTRESKS